MPVPLLDLKAQWKQVGKEIVESLDAIWESQFYINGPQVKQFEQEVAEYCGTSHAVGCASGSDALVLALMAADVGPGDEVIVPTFTFFATAGAVSRVGATPVFADCDPVNYNLLPSEIDRLATDKTKAVIPVHLFGQVCPMEEIVDKSKARNLVIIEDAAQSIGAKYKGKRCGQTGGDIVTFSFFPSKNLGCLGDGGMCVTNCDELGAKMLKLRNHGAQPKYYHALIGMNSRLDSVQAAALSVKLRYLEGWHEGRRENAVDYDAKLGALENIETPKIDADCWSIYNQYTVRVLKGSRDDVVAGIKERGIGCEVYYPIPLHLQECYAHLGGKEGDLPNAELAAKQVLSIPIYPELTAEQRDEVVTALKELVG